VHVDPDYGVVPTVGATTFIAAGTLIGQTEVEEPALATIMRFDVSNSLDDEQIVFNVGLIDTPETLQEAINAAVEIWDATMGAAGAMSDPEAQSQPGGPDNGGGGGDSGTTPPDRVPGGAICPPTDGSTPPLSEECCQCLTDYDECMQWCYHAFIAGVLVCLGVGMLGIAACVFGCTAIFTAFAAPCINKCVAWIAKAIPTCISTALLGYAACLIACTMEKNQCQIDNNCN